jgi:hypothetical protein
MCTFSCLLIVIWPCDLHELIHVQKIRRKIIQAAYCIVSVRLKTVSPQLHKDKAHHGPALGLVARYSHNSHFPAY